MRSASTQLGTLLLLVACGGESASRAEPAPDAGPTPDDGSSDVGTLCVSGDETRANFNGFATSEINLEIPSPSCAEACIMNHFQGRVSCPYGQTQEQAESDPQCFLPGLNEPVAVAVSPQLLSRPPAETALCSCACAGGSGATCTCPSGFVCEELIRDLGLPNGLPATSYCIPAGTSFDPTMPPREECDRSLANCGP